MFISTIIPTIGRASLSKAVHSVLEQDFREEECEVIVVNDSSQELPKEAWQEHPNVRVISTSRRNRSIARNTGAAVASGRYFHFLDDDDWMLPGAFEAFWNATKSGPAAWYHGAFTLVDHSGEKVVDVPAYESGNCFVNVIAWEWLPLQASIIDSKAFFSVGGFEMLESLKGGFEDIHLSRLLASQHDFVNMDQLVACIRFGDNGSTTNYSDMFIQNRHSRELCLGAAGTYQRLIASARDNKTHKGYWHAKIVYFMGGSAERNFRAGQFFTAGSRAAYALAALCKSGKYFLDKEFWQGLRKFHYPRTWTYVVESKKDLYTRTKWNWY